MAYVDVCFSHFSQRHFQWKSIYQNVFGSWYGRPDFPCIDFFLPTCVESVIYTCQYSSAENSSTVLQKIGFQNLLVLNHSIRNHWLPGEETKPRPLGPLVPEEGHNQVSLWQLSHPEKWGNSIDSEWNVVFKSPCSKWRCLEFASWNYDYMNLCDWKSFW